MHVIVSSNAILLENVLLEDPNNLNSVKIIDFGLSGQYDLKTNMAMSFSERCGTKIYMAPEMFGRAEYAKVVNNIINTGLNSISRLIYGALG